MIQMEQHSKCTQAILSGNKTIVFCWMRRREAVWQGLQVSSSEGRWLLLRYGLAVLIARIVSFVCQGHENRPCWWFESHLTNGCTLWDNSVLFYLSCGMCGGLLLLCWHEDKAAPTDYCLLVDFERGSMYLCALTVWNEVSLYVFDCFGCSEEVLHTRASRKLRLVD